jgi:ribonucrease Y
MNEVVAALLAGAGGLGLGSWLGYRLGRRTPTAAPATEPVTLELAPSETYDGAEAALLRKRVEEAEAQAADRAKKAVLTAVERGGVQYAANATGIVVPLPNEETKGRLIGREGRNIRSFEQVTGADLLIDDTPGAVVVSCFDPVRREAARLTLVNLMLDGRIHPGRIEEIHAQSLDALERSLPEAGAQAAEQAGVTGLPKPTLEALGRLRFRASVAQNVLDHSVEVARIAALLADELGFDADVARRAGLLHDIGKALPAEWEGPHALAGMAFLKRHGEAEPVLHAVGAHHHEIEPTSAEAVLVIVADGLSASRPGARREALDSYLKRIERIETLARGERGVSEAYAVKAGREVRVIVRPDDVSDADVSALAARLALKIEAEGVSSAPVRVTVVRETRAEATAQPPRTARERSK